MTRAVALAAVVALSIPAPARAASRAARSPAGSEQPASPDDAGIDP